MAPVTWIGPGGKRFLIRGTSTRLLCWAMKIAARSPRKALGLAHAPGNSPETFVALARELLTRTDMSAIARNWALQVAAPPCACGKPGLYLVAQRTYCRTCRPMAVHRVRTYTAVRDAGYREAAQQRREAQLGWESAVQHRKAKGTRRRRR